MPLTDAQLLVWAWRIRMKLPVNMEIAARNPVLHAVLLREECRETCEALLVGDVVEIADGLVDLIWVALGVAADVGIDLSPVFTEVARSNNSKTPGNLSPTGKLCKGPDFVAPRIAPLLERQGWKP